MRSIAGRAGDAPCLSPNANLADQPPAISLHPTMQSIETCQPIRQLCPRAVSKAPGAPIQQQLSHMRQDYACLQSATVIHLPHRDKTLFVMTLLRITGGLWMTFWLICFIGVFLNCAPRAGWNYGDLLALVLVNIIGFLGYSVLRGRLWASKPLGFLSCCSVFGCSLLL